MTKRTILFILFVAAAMLWSLADVFLRSTYYYNPADKYFLFKLIIIAYTLMAVQFHCFTSSFFGPRHKRWLPFAYGSLALTIVLVMVGHVPEGVTLENGEVFLNYGMGIAFIFVPLVVLVARNLYVFLKLLKEIENPIRRNQIHSLILGISLLTLLTISSVILPWAREYPLSHFGNLTNAFILSYAVIRHRLVDIRLVLRQGIAWLSLGLVGTLTFWLLLLAIQSILGFSMDLLAFVIATMVSLVVSIMVYRIRRFFLSFMTRAFQGSTYDYRQKLNEFSSKIHNVFSLKELGGELLALLTRSVNVRQACLLFPEVGSDDFISHFVEPRDTENELARLKLRAGNPIIKYLEKEQKILSRENLNILPSFLGLWAQEKEEIESREIELFVPLISRDRLIAILVLGKKHSGRYSLEDFGIIEDVTGRVAVSMEKEYLSEQLREREEELSVINSSSVILSSSLDIQEIFGSFLEELKKVIDVHWASIVLIEDNELCCMALSSVEGSAYQVGERVPMEGTGSGWVVTQKKAFIEPDLAQEKYFISSEHFALEGLRTIVYLPLIAKGRAIGSFIVASRRPNAYTQRHIKLLEQLASQIAMPLENSQLYAQAEKKARIDELTGLLNRRSLDEMIDNEISRHSRYGGSFSLAIMDLDSFKKYNDCYGHPAGDRLLRRVGQCIKEAIRTADHAFRYGGDEFAVLFPQTTLDAALQVTERIRRMIIDNVDTGDINVSASIGLASWPDDGISHTDIIAAADVTLYRAKRSGGNRSYCASETVTSLQIDDIIEKSKSIDTTILSLVHALAEAVDSRNRWSSNHSRRVTDHSMAMAKLMQMDEAETHRLETCALLHDIGKICISDDILNKPYELTEEEWELVKSHPDQGAAIVRRIPQLSHCAEGILHHHEWFDGSGYPEGLSGEDIPLESRIVAICDAFVTMTSQRPYSDTVTHEKALCELRRCAGTQFDPVLVRQFVSIYEQHITGTKNKAGGRTGSYRQESTGPVNEP